MIVFNRKLFLKNIRSYHTTAWLVATGGLLLYFVVIFVNENSENKLNEVIVDKQKEIVLPGQFNLVEDVLMFNDAMMRPPKECTLGKRSNNPILRIN